VAGEFVRFQANRSDAFFDNKRNGLTGEASVKQVAVPIHWAEYGTVLYPCTFKPIVQRRDRASAGSPIRNAYFSPYPFLVGL